MTTRRLAARTPPRVLRAAAALLAAGASLAAFAQADSWQADARKVASEVPPKLLATLIAAIDKGGPAGAIEVCRVEAPRLAIAASEQSRWAIRRVSLKPRNPKAVPDAWELATLQDFDRRAAAGESPATRERAEVVEGEDASPEPQVEINPNELYAFVLVRTLFDEAQQRVFTDDDIDEVVEAFSPVHDRLSAKAFELSGVGVTADDPDPVDAAGND